MSDNAEIAKLLPLAELVAIADYARRQGPYFPQRWQFVVPKIRPLDQWVAHSLAADFAMAPSDTLHGFMDYHPIEQVGPYGVRRTRPYYEFNGCLL